jgi:hypothetical protein
VGARESDTGIGLWQSGAAAATPPTRPANAGHPVITVLHGDRALWNIGSRGQAGRRRSKPGDARGVTAKSKGEPEARHLIELSPQIMWCPGRAELHPGEKSLLGLLGLLRLLRLFSLLRFLSHNILIGFNGWKRDLRHARRRVDLATSSKAIPTDSRRAAPHRHVTVIALSTAVVGFGAISNEI